MIKTRVLWGFVLSGLALNIVLASCTISANRGLKRHDLFTIPLGTLPGELDWFYQGSAAGMGDIQTRDGLIYVSNSRRGKAMVFNSYGELLTIVYDPSKNPIPSKAQGGEFNSSISSWPFRSPRIITAFNGGFLVGDRVEDESREGYNEQLFNRVILRFDRDGKYLGHLGREGFGGSPFPNIFAVDIRHDGGIVVTCHPFLSESWFSYWYTKDGFPITTIQISNDQLPDIMDKKYVKIQAVRPDPREWFLHLKADVYDGIEPGRKLEAKFYTLNLSTLEYNEPISLPHVEGLTDMGYPLGPPEYLGTTLNGSHAMLYQEDPNTYRIFMLNAQGRIVHNRRLEIDEDARVYRRFKIQNNGLLAGIFFGNSKATVSWWRLDEILKE